MEEYRIPNVCEKESRKGQVKFYVWALIRVLGEDDFYHLMDLSVNKLGNPQLSYSLLSTLYDATVPDNARAGIEFLYKKSQGRKEE